MHGGSLLLQMLFMSVPLTMMPACTAITSAFIKEFSSKKKPAETQTATVKNTPPPDTTGSVIVNGPYLKGVFINPDGSPLADAGLTIVETNFAAKTDPSGEFILPVAMITADTFEMRLSFERSDPDSGDGFLFDRVVTITLPPDLAALVRAAKDEPSDSKFIEPKLGLMMPRAPVGQPTAGGHDDKYVISSVSLPTNAGGRSFALLPHIRGLSGIAKYANVSVGSSVRFEWDAPEDSTVLIGYGKNISDVAAWTGEQSSASVEIVSQYENCSEETFRNMGTGPLDPILGKCGLSFSSDANAKLNKIDDYYFRVAVVSADRVLLSPIEKAKYSDLRWHQYHSEVESCSVDYFGPSLMDADGENIDPAKFGAALPACDAARIGQAFCTESQDNSASKCQSCETSLFVCK